MADQALVVDLEPFARGQRLYETDLEQLYAERRPRILGALLDLGAAVLECLPAV